MMETEHRGIVVSAETSADSVVIRWSAGVVVLGGAQEDVAASLRSLRPDGELEPASGLLIERLRMLRHGDFAAGVSTPGGIRLFSVGEGAVLVGRTLGDERPAEHSASTGSVLREIDVAVSASPIWIGIGEMDDATFEYNAQLTSLDFSNGVVPGRGIVLVRPPSAPLDPRVVADRRFDVVDFAAAPVEAVRTPLPIERPSESEAVRSDSDDIQPVADVAGRAPSADSVLGIRCSRDHFNNPSAAYCQVCGISMVHVTHHLVPGERPTLGFLVFDDGATFALDRSYVIGREPEVGSGSSLAPLTADDNEHTVSRSHAELVLDDWEVTIADLGSTNGTFVWDAGRSDWQRVLPNRPAVVPPGTSVAVGRKTFVYEPVARSV